MLKRLMLNLPVLLSASFPLGSLSVVTLSSLLIVSSQDFPQMAFSRRIFVHANDREFDKCDLCSRHRPCHFTVLLVAVPSHAASAVCCPALPQGCRRRSVIAGAIDDRLLLETAALPDPVGTSDSILLFGCKIHLTLSSLPV
jgi:hypothetical protein